MMRALLIAAAALLAGCAFGPREAHRYFVLEPPPGAAAPAVSGVRVDPTTAAGFYDTLDIVFSRAPGVRAYYQFNHWTEPPQRAIAAHLASRFRSASPGSTLILRTHLEEIYHDAARPPGAARITLSARLVRAGNGAVVAQRRFSHSAPASAYDAPGAVAGFRRALGTLLEDLSAWVAAEQAR